VAVDLGVVIVLGAVFGLHEVPREDRRPRPGARPRFRGGGEPPGAGWCWAARRRKTRPFTCKAWGRWTAFYTVTVKSQVDGRLDRCALQGGPGGEERRRDRPDRSAALRHRAAVGAAALAKDSSTAKNAKLNMDRYQSLVAQKLIAGSRRHRSARRRRPGRCAGQTDKAAIGNAAAPTRLRAHHLAHRRRDGRAPGRPRNIIHATDASGLVIITQLDPNRGFFTLPQDDLPHVAEAMSRGPLSVTRSAATAIRTWAPGRSLDRQPDQHQHRDHSPSKATFANPDHKLWPNQFVKRGCS